MLCMINIVLFSSDQKNLQNEEVDTNGRTIEEEEEDEEEDEEALAEKEKKWTMNIYLHFQLFSFSVFTKIFHFLHELASMNKIFSIVTS